MGAEVIAPARQRVAEHFANLVRRVEFFRRRCLSRSYHTDRQICRAADESPKRAFEFQTAVPWRAGERYAKRCIEHAPYPMRTDSVLVFVIVRCAVESVGVWPCDGYLRSILLGGSPDRDPHHQH